MRITMTPTGPALLAAVTLIVGSTLSPHYAAAQSAAPCPTIENDAERLACYDRALRPSPPAKTEASSRAREERAARESSATPTSAPATAVTTADRSERRERAGRETRDATAAAPPVPPEPAAAAPAERSGRRTAHDSHDEVIGTIVIAEVRAFTGRPSTFITDGGEVWTQIDTQRTTLPKTPFSATLKPGAMGSVFLVPENQNRAIRVHQDK